MERVPKQFKCPCHFRCYVGTDNVGKGSTNQWRPCLQRQVSERPVRPASGGILPTAKQLNGTDLSNDTIVNNRPVPLIEATTESAPMVETNKTATQL